MPLFHPDESIELSEHTLKNNPAFIGPVIILTSENTELTYQAKNGTYVTCFELIQNIIDFEKHDRPTTDWFGGLDCHHTFYEGFFYEGSDHMSNSHPNYAIAWGS